MPTKPMETTTVDMVKLCIMGLRSKSNETREAAALQLLRIAAQIDKILDGIAGGKDETR